MSPAQRTGSLVLLTAACLAGVAAASPDHLIIQDDIPFPPGCVGLPQPPQPEWEPNSYQKLQEEFTVEGVQYQPKDRRYLWTLRTRKTYPGPLGIAEKKFRDDLETAYEKVAFSGFFYDRERRKVGQSLVFFISGERGDDDRFLIFADLSTANMELVAARILVTQVERPEEKKLPPDGKKDGKDDKKDGLGPKIPPM
jgi:hypothetical protein